MIKKYPKVSVVMSNYNGLTLKVLTESLDSILKNDYPNLEVILVDNASTDKSVEIVRRKFGSHKKLVLIQNYINMYSQGLNLGVKNSTGDYVAFFNNDVVVENGFFQNFINFLKNKDDVALAQGKLISYYDHSIIDSVGETMDEFGNPITIGAGSSVKEYNEVREVLSVSGSCSILRKSVIEEIGYFDEDYGIGYEDMDLSLRAWMKGFKVLYFPGVTAFHKRAVTDSSSMVRAIVRWHFNKNRIATLIKNYPVSFIMKNIPVTILIYVLAGIWEIVIKGQFNLGITRFTSIIWVIDHLPVIVRKRKVVQTKIKKSGAEKIHKLLYKKTLIQSFMSFIKA